MNNKIIRGHAVDLTPQARHPKDRRPPTGMPFDIALRKFRKNVERAGTLKTLRTKEFYEKPTSKRKRKKAEAIKRHQKRISMESSSFNGRGQKVYK